MVCMVAAYRHAPVQVVAQSLHSYKNKPSELSQWLSLWLCKKWLCCYYQPMWCCYVVTFVFDLPGKGDGSWYRD